MGAYGASIGDGALRNCVTPGRPVPHSSQKLLPGGLSWPQFEQCVGVPVARIADTSTWQVETTDLTEINVVNVKEGDPVTITLDAISGLELTGKVQRIKGFGENKQGDIVYTIVVVLDKQDERLRWNMTAKVNIGK